MKKMDLEERLILYLKQQKLYDEINQNLLAHKVVDRDMQGNLFTEFRIYLYGNLIDVRRRPFKVFDGENNSIIKFSLNDWFNDTGFVHRSNFQGLCEVIMKKFNIKFTDPIDFSGTSKAELEERLAIVTNRIVTLESMRISLIDQLRLLEDEPPYQKQLGSLNDKKKDTN